MASHTKKITKRYTKPSSVRAAVGFCLIKKKILNKLSSPVNHFQKARVIRKSLAPEYDWFSLPYSDFDITALPIFSEAEIIHLHWIADFVDYPSFFAACYDKKIVWSIHDMNPFTGGCHYSLRCTKYFTTCSNCPQLANYADEADAEVFQKVKRISLESLPIHVVGNSHWITQQVIDSKIFGNNHSYQTIHFGVDTQAFSYLDKVTARKALNLRGQPQLVLSFGADHPLKIRKGGHLLREAISRLSAKGINVVCLVFGEGDIPNDIDNVSIVNFGKIQQTAFLRIIYAASDVFIVPSLQEAFGLTCLEAMACGTPVIAFSTGGLPDMVEPSKTGLLAATGNVDDLVEKIIWMSNHQEQREVMGRTASEVVQHHFEEKRQAKKFIDLYRKIL